MTRVKFHAKQLSIIIELGLVKMDWTRSRRNVHHCGGIRRHRFFCSFSKFSRFNIEFSEGCHEFELFLLRGKLDSGQDVVFVVFGEFKVASKHDRGKVSGKEEGGGVFVATAWRYATSVWVDFAMWQQFALFYFEVNVAKVFVGTDESHSGNHIVDESAGVVVVVAETEIEGAITAEVVLDDVPIGDVEEKPAKASQIFSNGTTEKSNGQNF